MNNTVPIPIRHNGQYCSQSQIRTHSKTAIIIKPQQAGLKKPLAYLIGSPYKAETARFRIENTDDIVIIQCLLIVVQRSSFKLFKRPVIIDDLRCVLIRFVVEKGLATLQDVGCCNDDPSQAVHKGKISAGQASSN